MPEETVQPKRRRRLSYKAKLWIAGVLFPTALLVLLAWRLPTAILIRKIEMMGGAVRLDSWAPWGKKEYVSPTDWHERFFGTVIAVRIRDWSNELDPPLTRGDAERIAGLRGLRYLEFPGSVHVDDVLLGEVCELPDLTFLMIYDASGVTREGLGQLAKLPEMETLVLFGFDGNPLEGIDRTSGVVDQHDLRVITFWRGRGKTEMEKYSFRLSDGSAGEGTHSITIPTEGSTRAWAVYKEGERERWYEHFKQPHDKIDGEEIDLGLDPHRDTRISGSQSRDADVPIRALYQQVYHYFVVSPSRTIKKQREYYAETRDLVRKKILEILAETPDENVEFLRGIADRSDARANEPLPPWVE